MVLARLALAVVLALAAPASALAEGGGGHGASSGPTNRIVANFTMPSDLPEEAEAEPEAEAGHEAEEAPVDDPGVAGPRVVDIPTLSLPSFADGELAGYFFVNVRLIVAEGVDAWKIRDKTHIIRDALIRIGHRRSVGDANHLARIDTEKAREILREGLSEIVPLSEIERLEITNVDSPAR